MSRSFCFTLDLEPDYASLVPGVRNRILEQPERVRETLSELGSRGIKGTAFTVGRVIEQFPKIIDAFEEHGWEFELHSYSHDTAAPDTDDELDRGCAAFKARFGRLPRGYRAPQGRITAGGIQRLHARGFAYDSSVFPSYFPNPFRYLAMPREPHFWSVDGARMLEIPIASVGPARLTLSTSYLKLLGAAPYRGILGLFGFPDVICFDAHLHDFIVDDASYAELPPFWKFVYGRHKHEGVSITVDLLEVLKSKGYSFRYLSEVASAILERDRAVVAEGARA
jgi:peptidoglycan/xylan/chitin deacetylase (PgdA/CDA1 family)